MTGAPGALLVVVVVVVVGMRTGALVLRQAGRATTTLMARRTRRARGVVVGATGTGGTTTDRVYVVGYVCVLRTVCYFGRGCTGQHFRNSDGVGLVSQQTIGPPQGNRQTNRGVCVSATVHDARVEGEVWCWEKVWMGALEHLGMCV
jgi:hypothetical protein